MCDETESEKQSKLPKTAQLNWGLDRIGSQFPASLSSDPSSTACHLFSISEQKPLILSHPAILAIKFFEQSPPIYVLFPNYIHVPLSVQSVNAMKG